VRRVAIIPVRDGSVVLANGRVRAIETVELNPETLTQLHHIAEGIYDILQTIMGKPIHDESHGAGRTVWRPARGSAVLDPHRHDHAEVVIAGQRPDQAWVELAAERDGDLALVI